MADGFIKTPLPSKEKAAEWLKVWGQQFFHGISLITGNRALPVQVGEGRELPSKLTISQATYGLFEATMDIRDEDRVNKKLDINLRAYREAQHITNVFVDDLRALRDDRNYSPSRLKDAHNIFSRLASIMPPESNERQLINKAWDSYYQMATSGWLRDLQFWKQNKTPPLVHIHTIFKTAQWVRDHFLTVDLEGRGAIQGVVNNIFTIANEIDLRLQGVMIQTDDEVVIKLDPNVSDESREHKAKSLIAGLCKTLNTELFSHIRIVDDKVSFTLECDLNRLIYINPREMLPDVENFLNTGEFGKYDYKIEKAKVLDLGTDSTKLEKVVSAAFLGAGLGKPDRVTYDAAIDKIFIYLRTPEWDEDCWLPDQHRLRVEAARKALENASGGLVEADRGSAAGALVVFNIFGDISDLEKASLSMVRDNAERYVANDDGPDIDRGWQSR